MHGGWGMGNSASRVSHQGVGIDDWLRNVLLSFVIFLFYFIFLPRRQRSCCGGPPLQNVQWKRCINLQNKFILKTKMSISSFSHLQFKRDRRLVRAFTFWQCCTLWNLNSDAVLFSCLQWLIQGPQPHQPMPEMQTSVNVRNELTSHSHPELSLRY